MNAGVQPGVQILVLLLEIDEHLEADVYDNREEAFAKLRKAAVDGLLEPGVSPGDPPKLTFDPDRAESATARLRVMRVLGLSEDPESDPPLEQTPVTETGSRYVDFLFPGLIGMNLMGTGMWGIGFAIADVRRRKFLKRLLVTPMRRSSFFLSFMLSRLVFLFLEIVVLATALPSGVPLGLFAMPMLMVLGSAFINAIYWQLGKANGFPLWHFYGHWLVDLVMISLVIYGLGGLDALPVDFRAVAVEPLQVVEGARLLLEQVDDDVAVVHHDPPAEVRALDGAVGLAQRLELDVQLVVDGPDVVAVLARGQDEVVRDLQLTLDGDHPDVLGLLLVAVDEYRDELVLGGDRSDQGNLRALVELYVGTRIDDGLTVVAYGDNGTADALPDIRLGDGLAGQ